MTKKLLAAILVLILAFGGLAIAEKDPAPATPPVVTVTLKPEGEVGIVGHRATAIAKAEGIAKFTWKSSAPKVASISSTGAIEFKKAGKVTFTATAKVKGKTKVTGEIKMLVVANRNETENSRVYLVGNYVYASVLYKNEGTKPVKKLGKTKITLAGIEGLSAFTAKTGAAKKTIKPGASGFVTFKLMKVNKAKIDLTKAVASIAA